MKKVSFAEGEGPRVITENGVIGIHGDLVLSGIPDETLGFREGHIAGRRAVPLVVGDDLDLAVLEDADAGISRAKIDTNRGCFRHFSLQDKNVDDHCRGRRLYTTGEVIVARVSSPLTRRKTRNTYLLLSCLEIS